VKGDLLSGPFHLQTDRSDLQNMCMLDEGSCHSALPYHPRRVWSLCTIVLLLISFAPGIILAQDRRPPPAVPYGRESVYEHWDRDTYAPGETAWFKAYVMSGHEYSTQSTVLYTDLLDPSLRLLKRVLSPLFNGRAAGQIELPDTLGAGIYIIRAFTAGMAGQSPHPFFEKTLRITGPVMPGRMTGKMLPATRLQVGFYPESGTLLAGQQNTVAFRASADGGRPASLRGTLVDDSGVTVVQVHTYCMGRGRFTFVPAQGRRYSLKIDTLDADYGFPLPLPVSRGTLLKVAPHAEGFVFELIDNSTDEERLPAALVGRMQGRTVFRVEIPAGKRNLRGLIRTDPETIREGILTFSLLNRDGMPLADRLVFVRRPESRVEAELKWDSVSFTPGGVNRFSVTLKEPVTAGLSVSVSDAASDPVPDEHASILSHMLLRADLPGVVEDPDWYFTADADSAATGLDLLMMTNGWSAYEWKKTETASAPAAQIPDPKYISVSGVVQDPGASLKAPGSRIMMVMTGSTFGKRVEYADLDAGGRFRIDSLLFFGKANLTFVDISSKKSRPLKVILTSPQPDSVPLRAVSGGWRPGQIPGYAWEPVKGQEAATRTGLSDTVRSLKEVIVGAKRKTPSQRLNEQYASGMFADGESRLIDLVNGTDILVQQNIFEYLKFRVPGLQVAEPNTEVGSMPALGEDPFNDPSGYRLYYRQQPTISSLGNIPMAIYLNEVQTSTSVIATIPANQIVMLKLFSSFAAAPGGGAGGALAIYTKDPTFTGDLKQPPPIEYRGFTVIKTYPTADIEKMPAGGTDMRKTLVWMPDLIITDGKGPVPVRFRDADGVKSFRIRIQGMTADGRFISIERSLSGK
jgi:hypothetical protein